MAVFLTGLGGICGAAIAARLTGQGNMVQALVRGQTQAIPAGVTVIRGDLTTLESLPPGIETVIHCAATSPAPGITADAIVRDNVEGTRRLLDLAITAGVSRFIYLSSLSAFGRIAVRVVDESTPATEPDIYGLSKLIGERLLAERASEIPSIALRLPGVVGPGAKRNWLASVCTAIAHDQPVRAYSLGSPFNNACHVDDLSRLVCELSRRNMEGHDMITLGAAGQATVSRVISCVMEGMGRHVPVIELPAEGRPTFTISSDRACQVYDYAPMNIEVMATWLGRSRNSLDAQPRALHSFPGTCD